MDPILECCAGLDVHQETVVACILSGPLNKKPVKTLKTFSTTTSQLLELAEWLEEKQCSHVAMESTGVYWKPVWNVLECFSFQVILANAKKVKNVPGKKTDMKDAEWIAQLLRCGLIEDSFVPDKDIRDLRDLTRYRKKLLHGVTQEKNRIHKILQDANIKLTTHMTDVFGVSGRNILELILSGKKVTPKKLEKAVKGSLKSKIPLLVDALNGRLRAHHLDMIRFSWDHLIYLEKAIASVEKQIERCLSDYSEEVSLLDSIPGVDDKGAATIIAEIGTDMSIFPTANHLSSWAGVSPGNNESAGKKKDVVPSREIKP